MFGYSLKQEHVLYQRLPNFPRSSPKDFYLLETKIISKSLNSKLVE